MLKLAVSLFIFSFFIGPNAFGATYKLESVNSFRVLNPAFLKITPNNDGLWIGSFGMLKGDQLRYLPLNGGLQEDLAPEMELISNNVTWPNEIVDAPEETFGEGYVVVAGGFLVPTKGTGALNLVHRDYGLVRAISSSKRGWFYHRVIWHDVDGDGKLDLVAARASKPLFGSKEGELVWFKQPQKPFKDQWIESMLVKGPDVFFRMGDFDGDGDIDIAAAEFFQERFAVYWGDKRGFRKEVVADDLGPVFDLVWEDLNGDGSKDFLVTNHVNGPKSGIFVFERKPTGDWVRRTLLSGLETRRPGPGQGSPGAPKVFFPDPQQKPLIIVSGDGTEHFYVLQPNSQSTSDWNYSVLAENMKSTVGKLAFSDVDGDGLFELFVPAYDRSEVSIYRLVPAH